MPTDSTDYKSPKEYLRALFGCWDGVPRIERVVPDILNAEVSRENGDAIRTFFKDAVTRVLYPGCRVETVFVLKGRQGSCKSLFFRTLAGPWYWDKSWDDRLSAENMEEHTWIVEIGEIGALFRSATRAQEMKATMTALVDVTRKKYARVVSEHKRAFVFVGTTSRSVLPEGMLELSRRFMVVNTGAFVNVALCAQWRDQLWAEAIVRCAEA